jgi:hypothetical protein
LNVTDLSAAQLWLPGQGLVPAHMRQAQQTVEEYDPDLTIGRHEQTGEWVILLKRGPEGRPFPVFGLGIELPAPEQIKRRLFQSDVRRNGAEIVMQIRRKKEMAEKESRALASDAAGQAAEGFDWAFRKEGKHPSPRIFVPTSKEKT